MNPTDPTPLWLSLYVPLGLAALLFAVVIIIWVVNHLK